MRIIQFTGAQGVGKSTLVRELLQRMKSPKFVGEVSRGLKSGGYVSGIDVDASYVDQIAIDAELILQYLDAVLNTTSTIIAERTAIDCLAYSRLLDVKDPAAMNYLESLAGRFLKIIEHTRERGIKEVYTFYIPPVIPFVEDGVRNQESQQAIDLEIRKILEQYQVRYRTIKSVSIEDRLEEVLNAFKI